MIPKCISSHNSGTITPPALQNFRYSENLYPREYLGLRAQRTVIKEIQKQVNSLPDDMPDKDAYNTINDVIKNILNSDFECLKQVSNDSIQSLKLCLAETKTTQLDKIGYFLLFSLLAIVKIFSYLSYYHELTLPNQNNDISQDRPDFSTSSSFDKEINIDQDTSSTSDYIVCRICEKQVPLSLIETHSKNCVLAFESSQTMISIDERLSKLSDHARQTILKRRPWPGNEMYSVNVIFPILHTLELIDRTISINTSSEFATEEIDLISEALIPITVRNNQEATDIIKKANTLVSEKFNTAFNYSRAISIVRRTSLSKDLPKINQPKISQFQFLKMISYGAFARVFLSKKIPTEDIYAIKVIPKTLLRQKNEVQRTLVERDILLKTDSPYMTKFFYSIISEHNFYLVMEYLPGGDLFSLLNLVSAFDEETSRIYTAQIVMALQFLRENKIIHRDLKPNNILIDSTGHLKLIDFGLSYYGMVDRSITTNNTFVGTPGYAAPEMILGQSHTFTADYWSLGSILYEFLVGEPPFPGDSSTEIFQKTLKGHYNEENLSEFSDEVQDLIHKLLCLDPNKRIGSKSIDEIKSHKWFESIRWDKMEELELPFIPELKDRFDTSYFIPPNQNIVDEIDEDILEDIQLDYDDNYNDVDDLKLFESVGIKQLEDKTNKDALDIRKRKHLSIDVPENLLKDLEENQFQRRKHRMVPRSSLSPKKFAEINCFNNNSESKTDFDFE